MKIKKNVTDRNYVRLVCIKLTVNQLFLSMKNKMLIKLKFLRYQRKISCLNIIL